MQQRILSHFTFRYAGERQSRPRGWVMGVALVVAFVAVVSGIVDVLWGLEFTFLFGIVLLALLLQWGFATLRLPSRFAAMMSGLLGVEYILLRVGALGHAVWPCYRAVLTAMCACLVWAWRTFAALIIWLSQVTWDEGWVWRGPPQWVTFPDFAPFVRPWVYVWGQMGLLLMRGQTWLWAAWQGQPIFDETQATLVWALVMWGLACWAGWAMFHHYQALWALLPAGITLASVIAYTDAPPVSLLPILFATLVAIAMGHHRARELQWERVGIDYVGDLWWRLLWVVLPIALSLVMVAAFMPDSLPNRFSKWVDEKVRQDEAPLVDSLGVVPKPPPTEVVARMPSSGLPTSHAVRAGRALPSTVLFFAETSDFPEPLRAEMLMEFDVPTYRWRSYTYDTYTGRGWVTTDTLEITYPADAPITTTTFISQHRRLHQTVERVGDVGDIVHAAGNIVSVNAAYAVRWRSEEDFFGATAGVARYEVAALVPTFTEFDLRTVNADYPAWLVARYTQLPDLLPARVITLAQTVTADWHTPYDKALALESFLRTYTYTLAVPAPPAGREVADYFLFDLQEGYCDYYATSMVVMARAVGLPARVVIGYVGGSFNPETARHTIRESDAHAWAEIYFPNYGWIEFEPTSGRPAIERVPGDAGAEFQPRSPMPKPTVAVTAVDAADMQVPLPGLGGVAQGLLALIALLGGSVVLLTLGDTLFLLLWGGGDAVVTRLYHRLRLHAKRLGVRLHQGDTPYELASAVAVRLAEIVDSRTYIASASWLPTGAFVSAAPQEMAVLVDAYVVTWYTPHPVDVAARHRVVWAWWALRWRLWLAQLWRRRADKRAEFALQVG